MDVRSFFTVNVPSSLIIVRKPYAVVESDEY